MPLFESMMYVLLTSLDIPFALQLFSPNCRQSKQATLRFGEFTGAAASTDGNNPG
jgi:hypothetical protein